MIESRAGRAKAGVHICRLLDSGMTQAQVAERLGVSQSTVSRAAAKRPRLVELTPHERASLLAVLGEMRAGPGFQERWSGLDVQTLAFALRRLSGVDLEVNGASPASGEIEPRSDVLAGVGPGSDVRPEP